MSNISITAPAVVLEQYCSKSSYTDLLYNPLCFRFATRVRNFVIRVNNNMVRLIIFAVFLFAKGTIAQEENL